MTRNPNRMQEAVDRLMATFKVNAAVVISYARGATAVAGISAAVGRTPFEVVQGEAMIVHESRDYMIDTDDLIVAGVQWYPASGDLITEADGRIYEVSVPRPYNVYESMGPDGTVFKVHTIGPK
jgi:hypothetical protein